jgi:flagellar biosynthetic protein FliO
MSEADVLRVIVTLILILMVIMAGAWAVRRSGLGRSGNTQALRTVAMQNLGNRAWIAVVEVEDARLVVGITAQQVTLLHTLPPKAPDAPNGQDTNDAIPSSRVPGFAASLGRALKKR